MDEVLQIALIGSGVMGEAFIAGLLRNQLAGGSQIIASDPLKDRRSLLQEKYSIRTTGRNVEASQSASVIILAVKPQHLDRVLSDLHAQLKENTLVLSIV